MVRREGHMSSLYFRNIKGPQCEAKSKSLKKMTKNPVSKRVRISHDG